MYTGVLLGERCTDSGAGPEPLLGGGVVVCTARALRVAVPSVRSPLHSLSHQAQLMHIPPTCLILSPQMTLNMPSFLIDTVFDEVLQGRFSD